METIMASFKDALLAEYSPAQWVLVFFLYSLAGWAWEVALTLVKERRLVNRGFLNGPMLPIYGFGAVCILLTCVPFKENLALVALVGAVSASVLEYFTGVLMESLFHVRYWDYSDMKFNVQGHICLLATATWAFFSVVVVGLVHPLARPYVLRIPDYAAIALSGTLVGLALFDTIISVRRALDLRALLESMERYARELEAVRGGMNAVGERMGEMVRAFAERVDETQDEFAAGMERFASAKKRVEQLMTEKRASLEEGVRERFAAFEQMLAEAASFVPDAGKLHEKAMAFRARYDRQAKALREARMSFLTRAEGVLHRNPTAVSGKYREAFDLLRQEENAHAQARRDERAQRRAERREAKHNKM